MAQGSTFIVRGRTFAVLVGNVGAITQTSAQAGGKQSSDDQLHVQVLRAGCVAASMTRAQHNHALGNTNDARVDHLGIVVHSHSVRQAKSYNHDQP